MGDTLQQYRLANETFVKLVHNEVTDMRHFTTISLS